MTKFFGFLFHVPFARSSRAKWWLVAFAVGLMAAAPVRALTIIPTFTSTDGTTTSTTIASDPNAATIEATINTAIQTFEADFSDPITVKITFQEDQTIDLGESNTFFFNISYSSYLAALKTHESNTNNIDALAVASLPNTSTDPVDNQTTLSVSTALSKALGLKTFTNSDGSVSLNTSVMNLSRSSTNSSKWDLLAVTEHEIDEVLGTSSGLGTGGINPADLWRYNSAGARTFTTSGNAFFSLNGTTDVAQYNQDPSGDFGDWLTPTGTLSALVQDAFLVNGATPNLGVPELTVLDAVGFDLDIVIPEPGTTALFVGGLALAVAVVVRRSRRRTEARE